MVRAVKLDQVNTPGASNAIYYPMAADYAEDFALDEAEREGCYVVQGCVLSPSGTAGKVDLTSGICFVDGAEVLVSAQSAVGTTTTSLASGLSSGQALWALFELDTSGVLQTNAGSGGQSDLTHVPPMPTPNAHRCPLDKEFVPFGATAVDAVLGSATGTKAKLIPSTRFRPYGIHPNEWHYDQNTWVYASWKSFTVTGVDATGYLKPGTRVSWFDGTTTQYGTVRSATFSTNTTVTLFDAYDYPVNNVTLSRFRWSNSLCPIGYPTRFRWAPSFTGFSANPYTTTVTAITRTSGQQIFSKTAHGLIAGTPVSISGNTNTTGVTALTTTYFVINANANDFQLSATPGGSALTLAGSTDSATIVAYVHDTYDFHVEGIYCTLLLRALNDGTSNNTAHQINGLPAGAVTRTGAGMEVLFDSRDNTARTTGVLVLLTGAGTSLSVFGNQSGLTNTASGGSRVISATFQFEYV